MKLPNPFGKGPKWNGDPDATPIHAWLDAAGFPWRSLRSELIARYGVAPHPAYGWDIISIPTEPPLAEGLLWPFAALALDHISTRAPALEFSGAAWFGDDARANADRIAAQLAPALGPLKLGRRNNTYAGTWRFGRASVALTSWPADLQSGHYENDAEAHEPRLKAACHIHIATGYRPSPTAEEQAWLDTFKPLARLMVSGPTSPATIRKTPSSEADLPYVRTLTDDLSALVGQIGVSADGHGVVLCRNQLYVIPIEALVGLRYEVMLPAKGPGGEWVQLVCRDADGIETTIEVGVSQVETAEDLAVRLAQAFGRPLERPEPSYDV